MALFPKFASTAPASDATAIAETMQAGSAPGTEPGGERVGLPLLGRMPLARQQRLLIALLIVALVALNAFFAAAEYSLLSVRRTQLEHLARRGNARARLVQTLISDIGLMISGTLLGMAVVSSVKLKMKQVYITATSSVVTRKPSVPAVPQP